MNDHETYLLLAAKRMTEPLTHDEETELEHHLASCPDCRAIAAGMRRDDVRLRAVLAAPIPVAPRVRERVLAEAAAEAVVAVAAAEQIVAASTHQRVVAGFAVELVVAAARIERVAPRGGL